MQTDEPLDELELMRRTSQGDEYAFAILFRNHYSVLVSYLQRLTGSAEVAEEIAQDAFLKAWEQRDTLIKVDHFRSWLFTVSRNKALNALRNNSRRMLKEKEWIKQQDTSVHVNPGNDQSRLTAIISRAITQLPAQQARAYRLSREQGLKHSEIAEQMLLSPETVKRHISLALQAIGQYIRTHYGDLGLLIWALAHTIGDFGGAS